MAKKVYNHSMMEDSALITEKKPSAFWELIKAIFISVLIVIPVRMYIAQPFIVDGASMESNFRDGDYLIIDELTHQFIREPERGEVVVFRYPKQPSIFFIKRIIGLPGETVRIENSKISITSGEKTFLLQEPYLDSSTNTFWDNSSVVLENGQYFVLGDNRTHSSDSRVWGTLDRKFIMGRALVRLWPLNNISFLIN